MSVISRFTCCTPRLSLVQPNVQRGFLRHFQRKSKPTIEKKIIVKTEQPVIEKSGVKIDAEERLLSLTPPGRPTLGKFGRYAAVFVPGCFLGCMIWTHENRKLAHDSQVNRYSLRAKIYSQKQFSFRDHFNSLWNEISYGKQMFVGVIAANVLVFGLWRIPALSRTMSRFFTTLPLKGFAAPSLTLSGFSHVSFFHLFINMYVVWSFVDGCLYIMNPEQLMAVYLAGITLSSLASLSYRVVSRSMIPSLGASGGILTLIALVCYRMPDSRISIAFVDQIIPHSFSAKNAILGVMAVDCLGLLMRWKTFDHAAHLGGAMFGLFYATYGQNEIWDKYYGLVTKTWIEIKKAISGSSNG